MNYSSQLVTIEAALSWAYDRGYFDAEQAIQEYCKLHDREYSIRMGIVTFKDKGK